MLNTLLHICAQTWKTFLYLGVGSCPHVNAVQDLHAKEDQLLPSFVKEKLQTTSESVQIVHIDPAFSSQKEFLKEYFALHLPEALFFEENSLLHWQTPRVHVIVAATRLNRQSTMDNEDSEDIWFIESLVDDCLMRNYKMVYQDYSGHDMKTLFLHLYSMYDGALRQNFRKRVLFDVSYNNDPGCMTNMEKYKPLYEADGSFMNLLLYSEAELCEKVRSHPSLKSILKQTTLGKFRRILNDIHVDYRRKKNGDPIFHPDSYNYDDHSSPEEIMRCLEVELFKVVPLLHAIGIFPSDKVEQLRTYFKTYSTMDRYKWYDSVFKLLEI